MQDCVKNEAENIKEPFEIGLKKEEISEENDDLDKIFIVVAEGSKILQSKNQLIMWMRR